MLSCLSKCTGLILKHREEESDYSYGSGAHRGQNRYLETTVKDIETLGLWAPQYIFWNFRAQLCPSATPLTSFLSQEGKGVVSECHFPGFRERRLSHLDCRRRTDGSPLLVGETRVVGAGRLRRGGQNWIGWNCAAGSGPVWGKACVCLGEIRRGDDSLWKSNRSEFVPDFDCFRRGYSFQNLGETNGIPGCPSSRSC